MKLNEIEVILFDLGNVLIEIDFSRVISEWQRFSGKNKIDVTKDSILVVQMKNMKEVKYLLLNLLSL